MHVTVADLVGHPGATRALRRAVAADELRWDVEDVALAQPVEFDVHLDSVLEGILVRGIVRWAVEVPCARCTEPVVIGDEARVTELFADPRKLDDDDDDIDEGYLLIDGQTAIDLSTLVRDVVLLDLPVRSTHPEGSCTPPRLDGVDIRTEDEDAAIRAATPDPRWEVLADLRVPDTN